MHDWHPSGRSKDGDRDRANRTQPLNRSPRHIGTVAGVASGDGPLSSPASERGKAPTPTDRRSSRLRRPPRSRCAATDRGLGLGRDGLRSRASARRGRLLQGRRALRSEVRLAPRAARVPGPPSPRRPAGARGVPGVASGGVPTLPRREVLAPSPPTRSRARDAVRMPDPGPRNRPAPRPLQALPGPESARPPRG